MSRTLEELRKSLLAAIPEPVTTAPAPEAAVSSKMHDPKASNTAEPKRAEPLMLKAVERVLVNAREMETSRFGEDKSALLSQARPATSSMKADAAQAQLSSAIAKVFEQTKYFERRLDELHQMLNHVEKIGGAADELFAPLQSFRVQLSQLAQSFAPMRAFQIQLAQMAETFEPMKVLHDRLAQVADAFQEHLGQLVRALDAARKLRERILRLAHTFDRVEQLQAEFGELLSAFGAAADETTARSTSRSYNSEATIGRF